MIAISYFNEEMRIYCPIQKCLRKMNFSEKCDYATQLSDYVATLVSQTHCNEDFFKILELGKIDE